MSLRTLSSFEKRLLTQSIENKRNGTTFAASYYSCNENWDDDITLSTVRDSRLTLPILTHALQRLISKNIELALTINEDIEYELLKRIKTDSIIKLVQFGSFKDEKVNCHAGAPPYLLRHIYNNSKFTPGSQEPLWELYVVDESLVIFHGQDVLFDSFSGANFHKLLMEEINQVILNHKPDTELKKLDYIFNRNEIHTDTVLPKSIYDNPKIHLPAKTTNLFSLQTQSFFKSIFFNTVRKPLDVLPFFSSNDEEVHYKNLEEYKSIGSFNELDSKTNLCGTTVFGTISRDRFNYLNSLVEQENICFRSLICGITMLCLKPLVKNFDNSVTFSMDIDLRNLVDNPEQSTKNFGLYYKEIRVECPLSLINDNEFITSEDEADSKTLNEEDSEQMEKLLEFQLKNVTNHVKNVINENIRRFEKFGFDDDDIRRMKYSNTDEFSSEKEQEKVINICDTSDIVLGEAEQKREGLFNLKNTSFTKSLKKNEYMSLCYSYCNDTGLNLCIHFSDSYNMENFVECFQSFIEE
ncbi:similar to Saccharomyces cerevisiae YPL272C Putative protein of unknown function [Maudiozyma barnettii]|uniref:Uncharacterized protein n=1 Tax=Maudiozyma barnettii TaxID=61262 RepID=A0A8H2VEM0_9SACH|nr:Pbi1p [Kazachstania barnettii]CAB4254179.1 similar to Saccharomyces cerevisiae YPL272C Putative protein of unknown function [Kazachstania barnettii]CAD1785582.1 similar to Saccharomyces cerevisiae YPL272C Putative protein of unknown function [Kazachstania barnettii]